MVEGSFVAGSKFAGSKFGVTSGGTRTVGFTRDIFLRIMGKNSAPRDGRVICRLLPLFAALEAFFRVYKNAG